MEAVNCQDAASEHRHQVTAVKKQIHLPPEVWYDLLGWLTRVQLGKRAALACRMFCTLARAWIEHAGRARVLPPLRFHSFHRLKRDATGALKYPAQLYKISDDGRTNIVVPIAQVVPPSNIINVDKIRIYHFDAKVLNFLQQIRHLLTTPHLHIESRLGPNLRKMGTFLTMLCNGPHLATFSLSINCFLDSIEQILALQRRQWPIFERKLRILIIRYSPFKRYCFSDWHSINMLISWLFSHIRLEDGGPKLLMFLYKRAKGRMLFIGQLVEAFLRAKQPGQPFLVLFSANMDSSIGEHFCLTNPGTREQLVFRQRPRQMGDKIGHWILQRCPTIGNGQTEDDKDEESSGERELLEHRRNYFNFRKPKPRQTMMFY